MGNGYFCITCPGFLESWARFSVKIGVPFRAGNMPKINQISNFIKIGKGDGPDPPKWPKVMARTPQSLENTLQTSQNTSKLDPVGANNYDFGTHKLWATMCTKRWKHQTHWTLKLTFWNPTPHAHHTFWEAMIPATLTNRKGTVAGYARSALDIHSYQKKRETHTQIMT